MLKIDDVESQIRWAVAIENAAPLTQARREAAVPLPISNAVADTNMETTTSALHSSSSVSSVPSVPSLDMLSAGGFQTVKKDVKKEINESKETKETTHHLRLPSTNEVSDLSLPSTPLSRYRRDSMAGIEDLNIESSGDKSDKGVRKTLRTMNHSKCEHEAKIVSQHHSSVQKDESTIHFLMNCIGSR